ncbi:hypothetical protein H6P81_000899 [Aristolochia fimbriata]|uniref:Pectinesterase inhibitor domain-containing protein n=1 Tax=Aristolochia fimbriata TaxID=158543 RepID=A0AAV7F991_ARIFI|nr:hypothetical protein H6P81_000899 [Aristolochia fimbriata]
MPCRIIWSSFVTPILVLVLIIIISCREYRTAASSSLGAAGGELVRHTCRRAARSNPSLNLDFCVASLEADPRSSSADLRGLGVIVTHLAEANATATQKRIVDLLAEYSSDTGERNRLEDCKDMYSDAFDDLKDAEAGFYSKRYRNANLFLGGALDNAVDCEDSWQESCFTPSFYQGHKYSSPLTTENYNMEQLCRIGLAITAFLSPHFS